MFRARLRWWRLMLMQDMSLPHSPRHAIFPSVPSSSTTLPLPETIHLLYSPQSSVLLHIHPTSSQRLSISDVTTGPTPVSHSSVPASLVASAAAGATSAANTTEASSSGSGGLSMGMGGMSALTGLGGYVGLGGKAALPVGTSLVGGEVLLARESEPAV